MWEWAKQWSEVLLLCWISDSAQISSFFQSYNPSFYCTGKAVFLARDKHHLADLSHLIRHDAPYLFQKYVKESHGKDVRVIVVGGRVVGTMLRCSTDGRMQSNCSLGKKSFVHSFWSKYLNPEKGQTQLQQAESFILCYLCLPLDVYGGNRRARSKWNMLHTNL